MHISVIVIMLIVAVVAALLLQRRGSNAPAYPIRVRGRTVVLVTGEIRFESRRHFEIFRARLRMCDVIVCTWPRCNKLALALVGGDPSRVHIVDDPPRSIVAHPAALQFYVLQEGVRFFQERILSATMAARMRTDAEYGSQFSLALRVPPGHVAMETDHAWLAEPATFVDVFSNIWDEMKRRRYFRHREEKRSMFPNFRNVARSDASSALRDGWVTRWGWLDLPLQWLQTRWNGAPHNLPMACKHYLGELEAYRTLGHRLPAAQLSAILPVPEFDAESTFLHHTLEHAAVMVLPHVSLKPRSMRCPYGRKCFSV